MSKPVVTLSFVRNAFTSSEGPLETVASFPLKPHAKYEGIWTMGERAVVTFPTGDALEVYAEANPACNYVHLYSGPRRIISWKAASDVDLMFLLPSGEEAYVSIAVQGMPG